MENSARPRICLITGSRGYLGGCVKRHFERAGWKVIDLVRNPAPEAVRSGSAIDFKLGQAIAPDALRGADALIHCAYDFSLRDWGLIHSVNVLGAEKLFQAARAAGVAKLIFISTMSAFEGCKSLYGKAKLETEQRLADGALRLRPGLIYGDRPLGMVGNLVAQIKKSPTQPVFGGGLQVLYLSHEEDLCGAIFDYATGKFASAVPVIAAHDQGWTFRAILEELARALGKKLRFIPLPWRPVWLVIKCAELCRLPLAFRSDSLVSLMNQNLNPSFAETQRLGLKFRVFNAASLKL